MVVCMADKAKEQRDQIEPKSEAKPLASSEAQALAVPSAQDMHAVELKRTNQSNGLLSQLALKSSSMTREQLAAQLKAQGDSVSIDFGNGQEASRKSGLTEQSLKIEEAGPEMKNANGKPYKVYTAEASQAVQKPGAIAKALTEGDYQSSTKLNVQITNTPEVSPALSQEDALKYISTVMDSGAAAIRQVEQHITEPSAINKDIENTVNHFKQSPFQFEKDVLAAFESATNRLDKPKTVAQRAETAGTLMPMFFFDGVTKPIDSAAANQMKLNHMTEEELKMLGIQRVEQHMPEVPNDLRHLDLTKAEPELLDAMRAKGREFKIIETGTADRARLDGLRKEAAVLISSDMPDLIQLKVGAPKIAALEEFLHGTQFRNPSLSELPISIREVHVKDFMIRHHKMLGLSDNDLVVLRALMKDEIESAFRQGWTWKK